MFEIAKVNNTVLIFSPLENRETASLGVFVRIGSRFEEKRVKGIAHFLEHMVFKGTKSYSHRKIKQEIEGRGGLLNAFTSQEMTAYHANFLKKNLPRTLDILLDMAYQPLFRPSDINKERNVILEEIKMYNDLPSSRAGMLLDSLLWKGHPLGEDVIGYTSTVKKIQRSDLEGFRKKYYVPVNMAVSLSGSFRKDDAVKLLSERIKSDSRKLELKTFSPSNFKGVRISTERKNLEQSHLCMGFRSVSYLSKERFTARLMNIILGANMSSRLFEELREKRSLCYDISTEARSYKDSGAFLIHTGLDKSRVLVAISAILRELEKIRNKEIGAKELGRARDYLLGQIAMSLETPQGRMWHQAHSYLTAGKIHEFSTIKKKIEAINPLQIKNFARKVFSFDSMCISCVGNIDDDMESKISKIVS